MPPPHPHRPLCPNSVVALTEAGTGHHWLLPLEDESLTIKLHWTITITHGEQMGLGEPEETPPSFIPSLPTLPVFSGDVLTFSELFWDEIVL